MSHRGREKLEGMVRMTVYKTDVTGVSEIIGGTGNLAIDDILGRFDLNGVAEVFDVDDVTDIFDISTSQEYLLRKVLLCCLIYSNILSLEFHCFSNFNITNPS